VGREKKATGGGDSRSNISIDASEKNSLLAENAEALRRREYQANNLVISLRLRVSAFSARKTAIGCSRERI
jgi:hypothetical protein